MKKFISIVLCLILLFAFCNNVLAEKKANLILEYNSDFIKAGQTLTAKFLITNNSGFGCVAVHVGFNKSTLELKEFKKTYTPTGNYIDDHPDAPVAAGNRSGKYVVAYVPKVMQEGNYSTPITYNGVFAELTFVAKKDCIPEIGFTDDYVDFFLDDENMTVLPYNLMVNKTKVSANVNFNGSSSSVTSTGSVISNSVSSEISSKFESVNSVVTSSNNIINTTSNIVINSEVLENEPTNPTIQNNVNNEKNEKQEQPNNNLTLLIIVLAVAVVLVIAAFLVKKLSKKQ